VQKRLLRIVAGSVKPGGKLLYSVCTLTRAETSGVVEDFNRAQAEFEPLVLSLPSAREEESPVGSAALTLWPTDFGGNGMFIAGWRRKQS
jgi:16S rRNA (cytosine967-C5)-methyltransferase